MKARSDNIATLVPEALLHAHVDVLLAPGRRRAVETAIAREDELSDTIDAWRLQNRGLHRLSAIHTPPAMPREMTFAVERLGRRLQPRRSWNTCKLAASIALAMAATFIWFTPPQGDTPSDPASSPSTVSIAAPTEVPAAVLETSSGNPPQPVTEQPEIEHPGDDGSASTEDAPIDS